MSAYYNEFDPHAAAWLRELIEGRHIAAGDVDERSIADVRPDDLKGYAQCHFFAGIGGWSYALRLAGWDDDRPVWTGSCPCQPFSAAGKQKGAADERHLWPEFRRLIAECAPATVFGEQVASRLGRGWLAGVRADLEALGYAVGAADLCAASVGAPHIRQRLYWLADTGHESARRPASGEAQGRWSLGGPARCGVIGGLADAGCERRDRLDALLHRPATGGWDTADCAEAAGNGTVEPGFWSGHDILPCTDGKARRIEPGSFPLAHGIPGRVGLLRGYGNAIVPQVAATFIRACGG